MNYIKFFVLTCMLSVMMTFNLFAQFSSTPASDVSSVIINSNQNIVSKINHRAGYLSSLNVKIVESESFNAGHVMDTVWRFVAQGMGNNATIVPQTTLDDTSFFTGTDILIISSGVIDIPANRVNTIKTFLMRKKNVYLQCEYQSTYASNQAFMTLVDSLGGSFTWVSAASGNLSPMLILGSLSTTPNNVPSISYFWYGYSGTGNSSIEYFMQYQTNYYGFVFTPPNQNYGTMISNSDQDWVRASTSLPLMQNIIYRLSTLTGIRQIQTGVPEGFQLYQNYPNPFNPVTKFKVEIARFSDVKIAVYDALGREVSILVNEQMKPGSYEVEWDGSNYTSGIYFYRLQAGSFNDTKKMVLVK